MARKLVFTSSTGVVFTASNDGNPFLITSISGLGVPDVNLQSQKSPYQDGTTYIDSLLQDRRIVLEVSVNLPNDFAGISTARREMVNKLNPKNGPGTLVYYTEDGQSYKITATVTACLFPNKQYQEPFLRAQVTFNCNDPYWRKVTDESFTLPTMTTGAESTITSGPQITPTVAKLSNGDLLAVYGRSYDGHLVSKTYNGSSWSSESVINAASSTGPSVIQLANGNILCVYVRVSDNYLMSRTFSGGSWGAESVVNGAASGPGSVTQLLNGDLFCVYIRFTDGFLVSRTFTGGSWGGPVVVVSAASNYQSVIQLSNGDLFLSYMGTTQRIVARTFSGGSWSAETFISDVPARYSNAVQLASGSIFCSYRINSTGYIASRTFTTIWNPEVIINASFSESPTAIQLSSGNIFIAYKSTDFVARTRIPTQFVANVTGDVPVPVILTFPGPASNPKVVKEETGEYIKINTIIAAGDSVVVNTAFGQKTVILTQGGVVKNGNAFLDIGSTFFSLDVGSNTVHFEEEDYIATATASMVYTERYTGI